MNLCNSGFGQISKGRGDLLVDDFFLPTKHIKSLDSSNIEVQKKPPGVGKVVILHLKNISK